MTDAHLTYQYKAHVREQDYALLDEALHHCAMLYNAALEERRQAYKMQRKSISLYDQMKQLTLVRKDAPATWGKYHTYLARGVLVRVDRAMQGFFARISRGEKAGYPRYRSKYRYQTLGVSEVTAGMLKRTEDRRRAYITIKGLPRLTLRTKRPLPEGKPKTLMITRRPTGYVVSMAFVVSREPLPLRDTQVGIDMGVNERMTLSDASTIKRRVPYKRRERRLRRRIARAERGSKTRRKKVMSLSRETYRNAVRNRNECHRVTTSIVRHYGRIAVEDLRVGNMTRSAKGTVEEPGKGVSQKRGLNKSITEQTWGILTTQLSYKAEYAGGEFVRVEPKHTSKTCSDCGVVLTEKLATYRLFVCHACGLVIDRDVNAARNIEARAFGSVRARGNEPALSGIAPHAQLSEQSPVHAEQYEGEGDVHFSI